MNDKITNERPKVSIIIPVYNVEKYLNRCMQSILNQTLKEIEIILVDDGSTDKSPVLCDEYAKNDSRVKAIHKNNEGLGFARNSGMEVATGEFVAFCDSDDWIDLYMYETLYNMVKTEKLDAIYTEFNPDHYPGFHVILRPERTYSSHTDIQQLMLDFIGAEPEYNSDVKFQVSVCKAIYSLDLIKQHRLLFHSERKLISEDLVFNIDFLQKASCVKTVPLQMYHYWLNSDSLTHAYRGNFWKRLSTFDRYLLSRGDEFDDLLLFKLRLQRTILLHIRGAISQEFKYDKKRKNVEFKIAEILDTDYVRELFVSYPLSKLPLKHRIFYGTIKTRCYWLMKLVFKLKEVSS